MSLDRAFIPAQSLFEIAGSEAITRFGDRKGRNLAIVSESTLRYLEHVKEQEGRGALVAEESLRYLYALSASVGHLDKDTGFTRPADIGDTLSISFTSHNAHSGEGLDELIQRTQHAFSIRPTYITPKASEATILRINGVPVDRPDFLIVDSGIVNRTTLEGSDELHAALEQHGGRIPIETAEEILGVTRSNRSDGPLFTNQLITFEGNRSDTHYARVRPELTRNADGYLFERSRFLEKIGINTKKNVLGVRPQQAEQYVALEHILLNEDVRLGFITGSQGSGKTILTYAAAVQSILRPATKKGEESRAPYRQIVLFKSNDIMGGGDRNLGALPGDLWEKIGPFMDSYVDAHNETSVLSGFHFTEMLMHPFLETKLGVRTKNLITKGGLVLPPDRPAIELAYSGFVRGRTFIDSYIIIDEAQNFTPYEVKTLIERAGRGSKIIVSGDPLQVDNPRCSVEMNGLTAAMNHFLGKPYVAGVHLMNNWRSQASNDSKGWHAPNY
ncbi:MAG: PhoH family protein [Candidatus Woesearchaeota archaeon]